MGGLSDKSFRALVAEAGYLAPAADAERKRLAVACESVRRYAGVSFDDQELEALAALSQGRSAQLWTYGEADAVLGAAACYHAMSGRRVHVVTRDAGTAARRCSSASPFIAGLGLSASTLQPQQSATARASPYTADIVYGDYGTFISDHLFDALAREPEELRQGEHDLALIRDLEALLVEESSRSFDLRAPGEDGRIAAHTTMQDYFSQYRDIIGVGRTAACHETVLSAVYDITLDGARTTPKRGERVSYLYRSHEAKMSALVNDIESARADGSPGTVIAVTREDSETVSSLLRERGLPFISTSEHDDSHNADVLLAMSANSSVCVVNEADFDNVRVSDHVPADGIAGAVFVTGWAACECADTKIEALLSRLRPKHVPTFYLSLDDELLHGCKTPAVRLLTRVIPRRRQGVRLDPKMSDHLRAEQLRRADRAARRWIDESTLRRILGDRLADIEKMRRSVLVSTDIANDVGEMFQNPDSVRRVLELLDRRTQELDAQTAAELLRRVILSSIDRNRASLISVLGELRAAYVGAERPGPAEEMSARAQSAWTETIRKVEADSVDYMENVVL